MRKKINALMIGTLGLTLALPSAAFAAADTNWTTARSLYEIHTWAGQSQWGHDNGPVKDATFFYPHSLTQLQDGNLLVSDMENHLLRLVTADQVSTYSGLTLGEDEARIPIGAYNDDKLALAAYEHPAGITADVLGNIYVADSENHAIRKITKDGNVTTLAGSGLIGNADGQGSEATFNTPTDVAVDSHGNVYVADTLNHEIRKITAMGKVTTLNAPSDRVVEYFPGAVEAAGDFKDGALSEAKFNEPSGLVVDAMDNLYVSDRGNQRIRYIDFTNNTVTTVAGGGSLAAGTSLYAADKMYAAGDYRDGTAAEAKFNAPEGLALTADGTLVIADSLNHAIRLLKDGKVMTLAGIAAEFGQTDGVTYAAQFNHPTDIAILSDGRLAIADEYGNRIRILEKYQGSQATSDEGNISIVLNGKVLTTEVAPMLHNGAVFLPIRAVGNALGFEVGFVQNTNTGTLTQGELTFQITEGLKDAVKKDGMTSTNVQLNGAPILLNGSLYAPVRFFASELNLDVQWDEANQTVVIRNKTF